MEIFICTQLLFLPKAMWIRNGIYAALAGELMVGHPAVAPSVKCLWQGRGAGEAAKPLGTPCLGLCCLLPLGWWRWVCVVAQDSRCSSPC